ncbi:hypothetical protein T439DRAFT_327238 [Meredithblackwellia eburnea MCA 4105]
MSTVARVWSSICRSRNSASSSSTETDAACLSHQRAPPDLPAEIIMLLLEEILKGLSDLSRMKFLVKTCLLNHRWLECSLHLLHQRVVIESERSAKLWLEKPRPTPITLELVGGSSKPIYTDAGFKDGSEDPALASDLAVAVLSRCDAERLRSLTLVSFEALSTSIFCLPSLSKLENLTIKTNFVEPPPPPGELETQQGSETDQAVLESSFTQSLTTLAIHSYYYWSRPFGSHFRVIAPNLKHLSFVGPCPFSLMKHLPALTQLETLSYKRAPDLLENVFRELPGSGALKRVYVKILYHSDIQVTASILSGALDAPCFVKVKKLVISCGASWPKGYSERELVTKCEERGVEFCLE